MIILSAVGVDGRGDECVETLVRPYTTAPHLRLGILVFYLNSLGTVPYSSCMLARRSTYATISSTELGVRAFDVVVAREIHRLGLFQSALLPPIL